MSSSDQAIGVRLREILIRDWYERVPPDAPRLRSLVRDLCRDEPRLRPALSHVVQSPLFRAALDRQPPLAGSDDPLTASLLMGELRGVFAESLCHRMEVVLQGLLPGPDGAATGATKPQARRDSADAVTVWARSPGARVIALGSMLGGAVVLGLAGLAFWMFDSRELERSSTASLSTPGGAHGGPADLLTASLSPAERDASSTDDGLVDAANGGAAGVRQEESASASRTVRSVYGFLARGEESASRSLLAGPALEELRAAAPSGCRPVLVEDLQDLGQRGPVVELDGLVTCRFPDGSEQKEARRFRVDTAQRPPRLIAARFEGIVRARGPAAEPLPAPR